MAKRSWTPPRAVTPIRPIPFGETAGTDVFNASELVAIADSRFLFCDNNINDSLLEMVLGSDGTLVRPLVRRPLEGLAPGAVDDMEGMALVEHERGRHIFITPSLSLKARKRAAKEKKKRDRAKPAPGRAGLIRVEVGETRLRAEIIPDFRDWFVARLPQLGKSVRWLPDDGGLNVEGLGWDPPSQSLVFGLRTPVPDGNPMLARVHVRDPGGPWSLDNLEMLEPVFLQVENTGDEVGVRCIEYDPSRNASLVVLGNSTSASKAPFRLHLWDGNDEGRIQQFEDVWFSKKMKVEGVTYGSIDERGAIVFVDDGGGYRAIWEDDARLRRLA